MRDTPWLSIIGLGEDGPDGLSVASRNALEAAEIIIGPARHLGLLGTVSAELIEWPVPFADGVGLLLSHRGKDVAVLASGDPFWFGAGSVITRQLTDDEWQAFPVPSTFSLAASRLGWPIEQTLCIGLHAAPFTRLRPHMADGARAVVLLKDGAAVAELAAYLSDNGFGASDLAILESLGGPRERIRTISASDEAPECSHPVCVGISMQGGPELTKAAGRSDDWFDNDGQITKRPARALTLSALAPKRGEHLLDIGGGSGSISIEWLLADPTTQATIVEANADRATRIKANARRLGVDRLNIVTGRAPEVLENVPTPNAIFIGGGLSEVLLQDLSTRMPKGTRIVANAVTLENEALLIQWQAKIGGDLLRIELSNLGNIGPKRGWKAAYPLVQWSVTL